MDGATGVKGPRGPRTLIWLLTARCNLRCPWCYAARFAEWGAELGTAEALGLIREAAAAGVRYIG
ncbi:MAG: heme d1 biosynthesis radical SAM protein NirJ, partial [Firmicutes bacterium]|nr:heme d1 biosynthesis radical SAM protein NirJ [Bacillota bacterium]